VHTERPESVWFRTDDGLTLEALRYGRGPVWVVLGHMRPADMGSWNAFATAAAGAGYTALTYNNRGYGDSEGTAEEYRVGLDARAAIACARGHGAEKVFYVGASMNGTAALFVGAREDLAGIAALSGVPDFAGTPGLAVVPEIKAPKLFVAARDDGEKADHARKFFEMAGEPRRLILYETGGHGTDMFGDNGPALTASLLSFVADYA
jgi:pimeloyl-ACP methyl ester carboxylesterase